MIDGQSQPILSKLSEDDFPWYYPATHLEVIELVKDPYAFVAKLNSRLTEVMKSPDEERMVREIVLADAYMIRVSLFNANLDADAPADFLIHGISGTGIITVRAKSQDHAKRFWEVLDTFRTKVLAADGAEGNEANAPLQEFVRDIESWPDLWEGWATSGDFNVSMLPSFGFGYGHLEIAPAGLSTSQRANRMTSFLVWGAMGVEHSEGLSHLSRVLTRADAKVESVDPAVAAVSDDGVKTCFHHVDADLHQKVQFSIMGRAVDHPSSAKAGANDTPGCFDISGPVVNGLIQVDEIVLKDYRVV